CLGDGIRPNAEDQHDRHAAARLTSRRGGLGPSSRTRASELPRSDSGVPRWLPILARDCCVHRVAVLHFAFLLRFCVDRGRGGTPARCRPLQSRGPPVSSGGVVVVADLGGRGGSILSRAEWKIK